MKISDLSERVQQGPNLVVLTAEQRETLLRLFDTDKSPGEIAAPLSVSCLALAVIARPLAERMTGIELNADFFTTWAAAGPALKSVLSVDGGHIVCQELRTRYPAAACQFIGQPVADPHDRCG